MGKQVGIFTHMGENAYLKKPPILFC